MPDMPGSDTFADIPVLDTAAVGWRPDILPYYLKTDGVGKCLDHTGKPQKQKLKPTSASEPEQEPEPEPE
ncbi:MAG: hypothetical protein V1721_02930 [Pseudomonadota bacterium]